MKTKTEVQKNGLTQLFVANLKDCKEEFGRIYFHLFSFLEESELQNVLEYVFDLSEGNDGYFKEQGKVEWFAVFHKHIRQTDFFSNRCFYKKEKYDLLTKDEEKEFKFLVNKVKADGYNKKCTDGSNKLFNEEYNRYLDLSKMKRRQVLDISINGELDSILWNVICIDNNFLYNTLLVTFEEYKFMKNN
jgi:hypothetical protein